MRGARNYGNRRHNNNNNNRPRGSFGRASGGAGAVAGTGSHHMERNSIKPGTQVSIVLKQDQPTGKLTHGTVSELLTNSEHHPRGIKVRLSTGQVGRVQRIQGTQPNNNNSSSSSSYSGNGRSFSTTTSSSSEPGISNAGVGNHSLSLGAYFPSAEATKRKLTITSPIDTKLNEAQRNAFLTLPSSSVEQTSPPSSLMSCHDVMSVFVKEINNNKNNTKGTATTTIPSTLVPWTCSICTFHNTTYELSCEMCDSLRVS